MKSTMPLLMAVAAISSTISLQAIAANPACSRYQPGHYVRVDDDHVRKLDGLAGLKRLLSKDVHNLKGVVYVFPWGMIESSKGVYDFTRIDAALALAKAKGKYFVIKWWDKTFWTGCNSTFVPSYVARSPAPPATNTPDVAKAMKNWCAAKIWEAETMGHEIRVLTALVNRYKNDPYFVGIIPSEETAISAAGQTPNALYAQLIRRNTALHAAAPNILISQNLNWPKDKLASSFDPILANQIAMNGGGGMGFPDTRPSHSEKWAEFGIARSNNTRLFIFPEFQGTYFPNQPSYEASRNTYEGIFKFATENLGAHAVLWSSYDSVNGKWEGVRYFTDVVIPLMNKYPTVTKKGCPWGGIGPTPTAATWTFCAGEGGTCRFGGTAKVRYGTNGSFSSKMFTNSTPCTNAIFGDPIPGIAKRCEYSPL